jgi:hypothetical protein
MCDGVGAKKKGYYLDSIVSGRESAAEIEVKAAQQSGVAGYQAIFHAPITAGGRLLSAPLLKGQPKPRYDVWLYTRNYEGFREYEIKLTRCQAGQPPPEMPTASDEEWLGICIAHEWMRFQL